MGKVNGVGGGTHLERGRSVVRHGRNGLEVVVVLDARVGVGVLNGGPRRRLRSVLRHLLGGAVH